MEKIEVAKNLVMKKLPKYFGDSKNMTKYFGDTANVAKRKTELGQMTDETMTDKISW